MVPIQTKMLIKISPMKYTYLLFTFIFFTYISIAQCDPAAVAHYNMGDFPFVSTTGVTVTMGGTNSGTLGPYTPYGCSPASCDANTIRIDPGDALTFNFSVPVYDVSFVSGVMNTYENGMITTNNGSATLTSNCPTDLLITGNAFEQVGGLASPVIRVQIPSGATSITINCLPPTQGSGNGVFTVDLLDCIEPASCNTTSSLTTTACDSYTSPSGNYIWTSSNTYMDTIPNAENCDSIITIDLTINTLDLSVSQTSSTLTSNESGATYQWLECPNMTTIPGATGQSFTAAANGEYAVIVNKNECSDTSSCYTVTSAGIMENAFGKELLISPNPTNGNFTIDLGEKYQTVMVAITDLSGRIVESNNYYNSQLLNLNIDEPKGVYLLVISSGDKKAVLPLVKE